MLTTHKLSFAKAPSERGGWVRVGKIRSGWLGWYTPLWGGGGWLGLAGLGCSGKYHNLKEKYLQPFSQVFGRGRSGKAEPYSGTAGRGGGAGLETLAGWKPSTGVYRPLRKALPTIPAGLLAHPPAALQVAAGLVDGDRTSLSY